MKIICYLSYGYPLIEYSLKMAKCYFEAGADMMECSLPARDPYLDSEFIAGRMADALAACDDYDIYLEKLGEFRQENPNARIVLLIYEATMLEIGVEKLLAFMKKSGINDIIYAGRIDHPEIKAMFIENGVGICCPVNHHMVEKDIEEALHTNGFTYMEARPLTGSKKGYEELAPCIKHLRDVGIDRPIYCGVGIHTIEDVIYAKEAGGDGVFIGSTLIKLYDKPEEMKKTIAAFKKAATDGTTP